MVIGGHVLLVALGSRVPGIFGALGSGVTIFFVISGFLLYRPFVAGRLRGTRGPRLRDYARRRALRIIPAYWLALTALAIYPGVVGNFRSDGWIYYGLLQEWFPHLQTNGIPQAWSLSVEATFYVLLPLFGLAAWRLTRGPRLRSPLTAEIWILAGLGTIRLLYELRRSTRLDAALYYLDWFLLGMAVAVVSAAIHEHSSRRRAVVAIERHPNLCWLLAFGVYCTFAFRLDHNPPTFRDHVLEGLFALLVVLPAVFTGSGNGLVRSVLRNRVLAWLGLISYGLYLWHGSILLKLDQSSWVKSLPIDKLPALAIGTCAITLACAAASYYVVERPLLRYKRSRAARHRTLQAPVRAQEP
jgi:peptidoglycan/LPS O-acetylase OafA/YrhL